MEIACIAIIGLGAMGTPLAARLLKAGYKVRGFDVNPKRMSDLLPLGLFQGRSAGEAAEGTDLVMLSLPNWDVVREVVEGKDGILDALGKGQIVADTTTVPPWETRAMAQRLEGAGIEWMDVPISGAANQAKEGNMVFMVGGKRSVFDLIKPVLDKIGKKSVYVGRNGEAAMLKVVVNLVLFLNQAAAIEGLTLGLKAGLSPEVMIDVLVSGAAGSDLLAARGKDMLAGNFEPKGPIWLAVKDMGLALQSARKLGAVLPMAGLYQQFLLSAHYAGWDREDATAVMKVYEHLSADNGGAIGQ
jgi:2-hydroxy-3-oxopropionate reductase